MSRIGNIFMVRLPGPAPDGEGKPVMAGRIWEYALLAPVATSGSYFTSSFTTHNNSWAAVAVATITACVTVMVIRIQYAERLARASVQRARARAARAAVRTNRDRERAFRGLLARLTSVGPFWWLCPGGARRRREAARAALRDLDGMADRAHSSGAAGVR